MAEKGTSAVAAAAGDGWEAHIKERYAESWHYLTNAPNNSMIEAWL